MSVVEKQTATVYRVGGKGKRWFSKEAAYRSAAIRIVRAACDDHHGDDWHDRAPGESCRYCSRLCDGSNRGPKHFDGYEGSCEGDPTHSYRYRLVGRLARWLRWRDEREVRT